MRRPENNSLFLLKYGLVFLGVILFSGVSARADWQVNAGQVTTESDWMNDLTMGDGQNNGATRIYGACRNNYMYEYTYNSGLWNRSQFGQNPSGGLAYQGVALGQPSGFSGNVLFTGNALSRASVFNFVGLNGTPFEQTNLSLAQEGRKTAIGYDTQSLRTYGYVACSNSYIYELDHVNGSVWNAPRLVGATGTQAANVVTVGLGRNTGFDYIYGGGVDGHLYEYTCVDRVNGGSFSRSDVVNTGGSVLDIKVALGRGSSSGYRVYTANSIGQIWESSYDAGWQSSSINASSLGAVNALAVGNGRNDGVTRLYAATDDDRVYELTWTGACWSLPVNCGSPSANNLTALTLGPGRNTGVNYLYAASADHKVYEYQWIPPTATPSITPTGTPTATATRTASPTASATPTHTPTSTRSATATATPTLTQSSTPSPTQTVTASQTPTFTVSATATVSPVVTHTATVSPSATATAKRHGPELLGKSLIAYPNPGKERITLAFQPAGTGQAKIQIFNMNGERAAALNVQVQADEVASAVWECASIAPGLYVVRVLQNDREIGKIKVAVVR